MRIARPAGEDQLVKLYMDPISTYEQFARVAEILDHEIGASFTEKLDGPDARVWKLTIEGLPYTLEHYSSLGNMLTAYDPSGILTLERVRSHFEALLAKAGVDIRSASAAVAA